jgi:hypothetical protein
MNRQWRRALRDDLVTELINRLADLVIGDVVGERPGASRQAGVVSVGCITPEGALLPRVDSFHGVAPVQQAFIGRHEPRAVHQRGSDNEAIGGIVM